MKIFKLIGSIAVCLAAGAIGSIFTINSVNTWYPALVKPAQNPPAWLFGPVWTTLYILMGISLFLIWQEKMNHPSTALRVKKALTIFFVQLVLNALWSIVFFGAHSILGALLVILLLWLSIIWTIVSFRRISPAAAWLLVPYLLWVTFASYLNIAIWVLNR